MKITLNNTEYDFVVNGTVGIKWQAEITAGRELDMNNLSDHMYLYYAAYYNSNQSHPNCLDLMQFTSYLTIEPLKQMQEYFWRRWAELEPSVQKVMDDAEKDKASKNQ